MFWEIIKSCPEEFTVVGSSAKAALRSPSNTRVTQTNESPASLTGAEYRLPFLTGFAPHGTNLNQGTKFSGETYKSQVENQVLV